MTNKFACGILLILCLILVSCGSSHIVLTPDECWNRGIWGVSGSVDGEIKHHDHGKNPAFYIKKRVWTPLGIFKKTEIELREFLLEEEFPCRQLRTLEYKVEADWFDVFLGFIPFMSTKTIHLSGTLNESFIKDE